MRSGAAAPEVLLDALPAFDSTNEGHVVEEIVAILTEVRDSMVEDAARPAFRAYVAARFQLRK